VPWREILGPRKKIVHDYMGVDEDVIGKIVTRDLAELSAIPGREAPPTPDQGQY
jgi:uncharacterized protein with HEPN domain